MSQCLLSFISGFLVQFEPDNYVQYPLMLVSLMTFLLTTVVSGSVFSRLVTIKIIILGYKLDRLGLESWQGPKVFLFI